MSDNYFEFKNFFLSNTTYESQIMTHESSQAPSHVSTPNITDDSTEYQISDESSESEVFESIQDINTIENFDTTYQLVGLAKRRGYEDVEPGWWVVDINDLEELGKIKTHQLCISLVGISGLFKYDNLNESLVNKKVIIEITYNGRGCCQWKKNKIIQLA